MRHRVPAHRLPAASAGFTLIETMVVIVIIGILLLVALPSYKESMKKSRRADGMRDLMELASKEERFYAQNSRYTDDIATGDGLNFERTTSSEGHYDLSVETCEDEGDLSACYVLKATPRAGDIQEEDILGNDPTDCGVLSVDSKGQRKASGPLGDKCW